MYIRLLTFFIRTQGTGVIGCSCRATRTVIQLMMGGRCIYGVSCRKTSQILHRRWNYFTHSHAKTIHDCMLLAIPRRSAMSSSITWPVTPGKIVFRGGWPNTNSNGVAFTVAWTLVFSWSDKKTVTCRLSAQISSKCMHTLYCLKPKWISRYRVKSHLHALNFTLTLNLR